ncbi:MAG: hypothetical protein ACXW34_09025 [Nitrospira sp.]
MGIFSKLFGPREVEATLGILDLSDGSASEMIAADRAVLASLFTGVNTSTKQPPACGVLFVYCTITADGLIPNYRLGLREIIRDSGATVVVVATPNAADSYHAAAKRTGYGTANLVMTLDRKESAFGSFFRALFSDMKKGTSMPMAWVKLAPQHTKAQERLALPVTIFLCEAGQVALS